MSILAKQDKAIRTLEIFFKNTKTGIKIPRPIFGKFKRKLKFSAAATSSDEKVQLSAPFLLV